jgi:hypothetical protein
LDFALIEKCLYLVLIFGSRSQSIYKTVTGAKLRPTGQPSDYDSNPAAATTWADFSNRIGFAKTQSATIQPAIQDALTSLNAERNRIIKARHAAKKAVAATATAAATAAGDAVAGDEAADNAAADDEPAGDAAAGNNPQQDIVQEDGASAVDDFDFAAAQVKQLKMKQAMVACRNITVLVTSLLAQPAFSGPDVVGSLRFSWTPEVNNQGRQQGQKRGAKQAGKQSGGQPGSNQAQGKKAKQHPGDHQRGGHVQGKKHAGKKQSQQGKGVQKPVQTAGKSRHRRK